MKRIFTSCIIFTLILSGCTESTIPAPTNMIYKTFTIGKGDFTVSDKIIAPVEGDITSALAFKESGRIGEILVHQGDTVKKGQLLARLTNQEEIINYNGLSDVIDNIYSIKRSTTITRNNTVAMRNAVSKLYDTQIDQAALAIKSLEISLDQARKSLGNQTGTLDDSYHLQVNGFTKLADSILYQGDRILGITTNFEYSNDEWEPYLGVRIGDVKSDSDNLWNKLYAVRGEILAKSNTHITEQNAKDEIKELQTAYDTLNDMINTMCKMLENSIVGGGLTQDRLDAWISQWYSFKSSEQTSETAFTTWKDDIIGLIDNTGSGGTSVASMNIDTLSTQLESAQKNINLLKAEKESKLRELNTNISQIDGQNSQLDLQISQTSMNQSLAGESVDGTAIYAPYDGVILEKNLDIGNLIQAGTPIFTITSKGKALIKTYIDNYIYDYEKGDTITMKNFYTKESFTGVISLIQKEKDPIHNKNYAEITIEKYSGDFGERMELTFSHKEKTYRNGVIIPISSIITQYGPSGVYVLDPKSHTVHFTIIQILGSDASYAEVLGVSDGSTIITEGKDNMIDGSIVN